MAVLARSAIVLRRRAASRSSAWRHSPAEPCVEPGVSSRPH